jgi:Holliday junction resolvase-like predicted endonuclease
VSTNFAHGKDAETKAESYLIEHGFKILNRNWRTRICEIDIVAKKKNSIFFVEVKYRKNLSQGEGIDYITSKKLKQMTLAANLWVHENNWKGDFRLSAISIQGDDYVVSEFIEDCT